MVLVVVIVVVDIVIWFIHLHPFSTNESRNLVFIAYILDSSQKCGIQK